MKIITIGGIPGSGKTTLGKKLGQEYNCLSLELEPMRWGFFHAISPAEILNARAEYLNMCIYKKRITNEEFIQMQIDSMEYINQQFKPIFNELKSISTIEELETFIKKYDYLINYVPDKLSLNILDTIIVSHALVSRLDIQQIADEKILLDESIDVCLERFKSREKLLDNKYDNRIIDYLKGYKECINE